MPRNQIRTLAVQSFAIYSEPDRLHRFWLERLYAPGLRTVHFNMLNPSTATEEFNDATVAKCERYALAWGFNRLIVTNAFSFRARFPDVMQRAPQPNLPENDTFILKACQEAELTVCGWSDHIFYHNRYHELQTLLQDQQLTALRVNRSGAPAHPVYLDKTLTPQPFIPSTTPRLL